MLKKMLLLMVLFVMSVLPAVADTQKPLLIAGWNRFQAENDVTWWEQNAHVYDDLNFDAVMHVIENYDSELMDRVIAEDVKRNYQLIVTVDGVRFLSKVFDFFEKYGHLENAAGKPLIRAAVIGWDKVNNQHPDDEIAVLGQEMQAARDIVYTVAPDLPVYLCVTYSPEYQLDEWYDTMKSIPHDGIWMYDVWGWDADLQAPIEWFRAKGETNIVNGGVFGFKYWRADYRADLVERSAIGVENLWKSLKRNGYNGVNLQFSIDANKQHGSTRLFDDDGNKTVMYHAVAALD